MIATDSQQVREAIRCCYQESPTDFMSLKLYDVGAYPEPPICSKLTWRITEPWTVTTEAEAQVLKSIHDSAKKSRQLSDQELLSLLNPPDRVKEQSKKGKEHTA
jgi:hypothetical protein